MIRRLTPAQLGLDLGVGAVWAIVFAIVASRTTTYAESEGWLLPTWIAAGAVVYPVLLGGALALRRLSPALSLGLAWCGAIVQMTSTYPPDWADLAIVAVVFASAAYGGRVVYWAGLASAVVGGVVATHYIARTTLDDLSLRSLAVAGSVLLAALVTLVLSWTAGALARSALRARSARDAEAAARADAAAADERERIARDMHDVVAHSLAVVVAQADGARYAAAQNPDAATAALATISATARSALADVRLLLTQLRHRQGDGPQPTLADLDELYAQVRAAGVPVSVEVDPAPPGVPPAGVQLAVYRILQEALTNALRHGAGAPVAVRLSWHPDRVDLAVRNRMPAGGRAPGAGAGHGLIGMAERAQLAGGALTAAERSGDFVVEATLPVGVRADADSVGAVAGGAAL